MTTRYDRIFISRTKKPTASSIIKSAAGRLSWNASASDWPFSSSPIPASDVESPFRESLKLYITPTVVIRNALQTRAIGMALAAITRFSHHSRPPTSISITASQTKIVSIFSPLQASTTPSTWPSPRMIRLPSR